MRSTAFLLLLALQCSAQAPTPAAAPSDARSTPRGAVFGFLEACRQDDYRRAASFLDVHARRNVDPAALARQLKDVIDQRLRTNPGTLSNHPDGDLTDGLDPRHELLGTVSLGGREVDLLLERVSRAGSEPVWLFAPSTLSVVPLLHESLENSWAQRTLPAWALVRGPLDTALWQWAALLLLIAFSVVLARLVARVAVWAVRPVVRRTQSDLDDVLVTSLVRPVRLLLMLLAFRAGVEWIVPAALLRLYLGRLLALLIYLALAWIFIRLIDVVSTKAVASMTGLQRASASSVVPLLRRTAKAAAVVLAILATLAHWGYDTTALLAGLGVGGIAIALAAQKTIEHLFGGVAITTDKPVLLGDYCRYGDRFGTVEDIGLRSTRIRTLERTLVTIPNGQFSSMEIENFGRRDKIWFHPILRLRLDTTPEQVRFLIAGLRELLLAHPKVDPDPARVRFLAISQYSLDIEVFAYVKTTDFDEYLVVQEELLLAFLDLIKQAGAALAVPAQLNLVTRVKA
jgi:MscS family membrane protein